MNAKWLGAFVVAALALSITGCAGSAPEHSDKTMADVEAYLEERGDDDSNWVGGAASGYRDYPVDRPVSTLSWGGSRNVDAVEVACFGDGTAEVKIVLDNGDEGSTSVECTGEAHSVSFSANSAPVTSAELYAEQTSGTVEMIAWHISGEEASQGAG